MENFSKYLAEGNKGLTIFDIDDTMFTTKARVLVKNVKGGKPIALTPQMFNKYKLKKGEYQYSRVVPVHRRYAKNVCLIGL